MSGLHDFFYLVDYNSLILCVSNRLFSVDIESLFVNWVIQGDLATCFEVCKMYELYIVHGELLITYIKQNGEKQWSLSGSDIFVTLDGENEFQINNGMIIVRDWEENQYILDKEGNLK